MSSISSDRILPTSIAAECIESISSETRRANASLSFSRWSLLVCSICCSSAAALWPSVSICWVRRSDAARARFDGARGDVLDLAQPVLDALADHALQRLRASPSDSLPALSGMTALDRFAGALGGVRGGFLDLHQRGDQRRAGLGAEARRLALDLGEHRGELGQLRLRIADAVVDAGEQRREAVLLLGDLRRRSRTGARRLRPRHRESSRFPAASRSPLRPAGRRRPAPRRSQFRRLSRISSVSRSMLSRKRGRALGDRADRVVLRAGLRRQRVELGPRAGQRFEEVVGALVAVRRKLGEALVDQRQAAVDLGDHPLRGAVLLGDPAATAPSSERVGMVDDWPRALRRLRRRPCRCPAEACSTSAATAPDWTSIPERISSSVAEVRSSKASSAPEKPDSASPTRAGGRGAGGFDLGQPRGEPVGRLGDELVGLAGAFGELADLLAEARPLLAPTRCRSSASCSASCARGLLGARQVVEQHGDVVARGFGGAVERFAMAQQLLAAAVEFAGDPAELAGRLVAELHQMLRDHRQLGAAVVDSLRQHFEQALRATALSARIAIDRPGEALGFLAPGAAEHQPDEAQQRQRPGGDRDPLRDRGRGQRLTGQASVPPTRRCKPATAPRASLSAMPSTWRPPAPRSSARLSAHWPSSNAGSTTHLVARSDRGAPPHRVAGGRGSARCGVGVMARCSLPSLTRHESD